MLSKGSTATVGLPRTSEGPTPSRALCLAASSVDSACWPGESLRHSTQTAVDWLLAYVRHKPQSLRGTVRIKLCCSPLSPMARRAALIRLLRVDLETIRPPQTAASISSLLITCPGCERGEVAGRRLAAQRGWLRRHANVRVWSHRGRSRRQKTHSRLPRCRLGQQ